MPYIPSVPGDEGCTWYSACLQCPMPQCRWDVTPAEAVKLRRSVEDRRMVAVMRERGLSAEEAAEHFALTVRTIYRILARAKNGQEERNA